MPIDKRISIFSLLRKEGKLEKILIYPAKETETDPFEHTKTLSYLNPVPVDALIRNISTEALTWKYYGTIPIGSRECIVEKKYKNLFLAANKIKIGGDYFNTYKDDVKGFGIITRQDYLIVILELKPANV